MGRTNVVIDDELVERVKELYGLRSTREAIDFALRSVAGTTDQSAMLEMKGSGWEGDLEEMRGDAEDAVGMVADPAGRGYAGEQQARSKRKPRGPRGAAKRVEPRQ